jgi:predicted metalloprotease with PDZ domain
MLHLFRCAGLAVAFVLTSTALALAQAPVTYRLSFPDYVRHLADVEVVFDPLEVHMSRTSPGRYAIHEFAKNVFDVQFTDGAGRPLTATQPTLSSWRVKEHGGTVRVRYRVFGGHSKAGRPASRSCRRPT